MTNIEIWRNAGGNSLSYVEIVSVPSSTEEYTIQVSSSPGMLAGVVYKFVVRTVNDQGDSEFSDFVQAAASDFPAAPSAPTRNLA